MRNQYAFATEALTAAGHLRLVKSTISGLCVSMAVFALIVQLHPCGPKGFVPRLIEFALVASTLILGAAWQFGPWPPYRVAVAFVVWCDLGLAVGAALLSSPASRLCAMIHMGMIGLFVAFLLGWPLLLTHCAFATVWIIGVAVYSGLTDHVSFFDLYIFWAPALSSVVVLPLMLLAVIDGVRRSLRRTVRAALHDPLTGLYNRWGLQTAMQHLAVNRTANILAAAVIDLDDFKTLNDSQGHEAGDAALRHLGEVLRCQTRVDDIVARMGGDEFVVVARMGSAHDVMRFAERVTAAVHDAGRVTASVGVAWQDKGINGAEDLDTLLQRADRLMYEAKRSGGNRLVQARFDRHPADAERFV